VLDKALKPDQLRIIDTVSLEWLEKAPGQFKPQQKVSGEDKPRSLDIPTFFVAFFRRDPTAIYSYGFFVAAINTIAARQQVINDLYRIMQKTGFPRLDITVIEEVLMKNVPPAIKMDQKAVNEWKTAEMNTIRAAFDNLRADQGIVHGDSVEAKILNDKNPGAGLDITSVIETLNAQNQAGLKTMSTVIGRGAQGVNTGSVEARIAAMNADELNVPLAEVLSKVFSFIMHQTGYQGFAEATFKKAELRPDDELEPQRLQKSQRLLADLSYGIITDDEYHMEMYGRPRPDSAPELSGTGFLEPAPTGGDGKTPSVSPNGGSLNRSLAGKSKAGATSK
jgi:hypothetical protein